MLGCYKSIRGLWSCLKLTSNSVNHKQLGGLKFVRWCTVFVSKYPDITYPKVSIPEFLFQKFKTDNLHKKTAIINGETGLAFSFHELESHSKAFAQSLKRRGVNPGDVICIFAENSPEYLIAMLGSFYTGSIVTTATISQTSKELNNHLKISNASVLITTSELESNGMDAIAHGNTDVKNIIVIGKSENPHHETYDKLIRDGLQSVVEFPKISIDDVALLPFSSGTTGLSKGVMLTHENIISNIQQLSIPREIFLNDVQLCVLPLSHIYGCVLSLCTIHAGATLVTLKSFVPQTFLGSIAKYKVTLAPIVPPIFLFLANHPLVEKYDCHSIRNISNGAAPLSKELQLRVQNRLETLTSHRIPVSQGYGLTETSPGISISDVKYELKHGSSGFLLPNMKSKIICLETNKSLGIGQKGEIVVKGPNIMKGYFRNEEATKQTISNDGWLKTGDIGYFDSDGYLFVIDRLKELIKYKGFQVPPAELEFLLLSHPKIADAAVIGKVSEEVGELPMAFIVPKQGCAETLTVDEVTSFINNLVSDHKKLRGGVIFIESIPKSPAGKILRRVLKEKI